MRTLARVLCEAIVIAITIVIIGVITTYAWMYFFPPKGSQSKEPVYLWPMVGSLFITGFLAYLLREYTGINKYVCGVTQGLVYDISGR